MTSCQTSETKEALLGALSGLMESGEFSDCQLTCGDQVFALHKAIVCSQSPVIKAAFAGQFQEAHSGELKAGEFDPLHIEAMIEFLYTGAYNSTRMEQPDESEAAAIFHLGVNATANYYQIDGLSKMSRECFSQALKFVKNPKAFIPVIRLCGTTGDKALHAGLAQALVPHLSELVQDDNFVALDLDADLLFAMLKKIIETKEEYLMIPEGHSCNCLYCNSRLGGPL